MTLIFSTKCHVSVTITRLWFDTFLKLMVGNRNIILSLWRAVRMFNVRVKEH